MPNPTPLDFLLQQYDQLKQEVDELWQRVGRLEQRPIAEVDGSTNLPISTGVVENGTE